MDVLLERHVIKFPEFLDYNLKSHAPYSDALNINVTDRQSGRTKRPLNAFMLFAKLQRDRLTMTSNVNHSDISRALGKLWRSLSSEQKVPFLRGSKLLAVWHRQEFPDYKYQPRKRPTIMPGTGDSVRTVKRRRPRKLDLPENDNAGWFSVPSVVNSTSCLSGDASSCLQLQESPDVVGLSYNRMRRNSSPFSPMSSGASLSSGYESDSVSELSSAGRRYSDATDGSVESELGSWTHFNFRQSMESASTPTSSPLLQSRPASATSSFELPSQPTLDISDAYECGGGVNSNEHGSNDPALSSLSEFSDLELSPLLGDCAMFSSVPLIFPGLHDYPTQCDFDDIHC